MTHKELTKEIATRLRINQTDADRVLRATAIIVKDNLLDGEKTHILGMGTFDLGSRAARRGVDPRNMSEIRIPAMASVLYRASEPLKKIIRRK